MTERAVTPDQSPADHGGIFSRDNNAKVLCVYSIDELIREMGDWEHRES